MILFIAFNKATPPVNGSSSCIANKALEVLMPATVHSNHVMA